MIYGKPWKTFGRSYGINNVKDPLTLTVNELQAASNIDIDDEGFSCRRKGKTSWKAGTYKWLFPAGPGLLAVKLTSLVIFTPDKSETVLRSDLELNRRMVYKKVLNRVYYTNGQVIGYVQDGANFSLPTPTENFKKALPPGNFLTTFNGRLYVGVGNLLLMSDVGEYGQYDERFFGKQFEQSLTMVEEVGDGMFISAGKTYWLGAIDPMEMVKGALKEVAPYGAIPYMSVHVDGGFITKDKTVSGMVVLWGSEKGICLGADGGEFENLTGKTYTLPTGKSGSALYRTNHKGTNQVVMTISQ